MTVLIVAIVGVGIACWLAVIANHLRNVAQSLRVLADVEKSRPHFEGTERCAARIRER